MFFSLSINCMGQHDSEGHLVGLGDAMELLLEKGDDLAYVRPLVGVLVPASFHHALESCRTVGGHPRPLAFQRLQCDCHKSLTGVRVLATPCSHLKRERGREREREREMYWLAINLGRESSCVRGRERRERREKRLMKSSWTKISQCAHLPHYDAKTVHICLLGVFFSFQHFRR